MASTISRVVLDTTVLVEALLDPQGGGGLLLRAAARRQVDLIWSESLRARFESALLDTEVRAAGTWSVEEAVRLLDGLEILAVEIDEPAGDPSPTAASPAVDDLCFELAERASAVLASTDPDTLARSGHLGVEALRPETVVAALASLP